MEETLAQAREHAGVALAETLRALGCLLDAAALATTRATNREPRGLARLAALLETAAETLEQQAGRGASTLLQAVADALEAEIARWEERGREDPEARAVLRAFLGLRELLWEFGVRPGSTRARSQRARPQRAGGTHASDGERAGEPPRVERVPVEG